ncbi:MAG: hypothetical protein SFU27_02830, partial [Thermonemataceae bacterium]|nr:hypothetical protein [Thermonemataceae bacterium]
GSKDLSNDDNMIAAQVTMRFLKDKKNVMNEFKERKLMAMEDRDAPSADVQTTSSRSVLETARGPNQNL